MPRAVACIALRSRLDRDETRPRCYTEHLSGWHVCGWFADAGRTYGLWEAEGESADDLWHMLCRKARQKAPLWVLSPRIARDVALLRLWERAEQGDVRLGEGSVLANPPTIIAAFTPRQLIFLDSRNWFPWRPAPGAWTRQTAFYLAECFVGMEDVLRTKGWGSLRMTVGAQALWTWRYAFLKHSIVCHAHPVASGLEREAYYGGRCEPMRLGHVPPPCYELDVRSAYASAYTGPSVPCLLESVHGPMSASALRYLLERGLCCAEVVVETDEPAYPVRRGGRVLWPVGRFRTVLHSPELQDAADLSRVKRVLRAACYRGFPALAGYGESLYAIRQAFETQGQKALAGWAKGLLVCLPGALGRSDRAWRPCPWYEPRRPWEQRVLKRGAGRCQTVRVLAGSPEYEYNGGWAWNSVPAMAGWVTSAARMRLLSEVRKAGWSHVHYIDTDCLYVDREGLERLCPLPRSPTNVLGTLELVARHDEAWIGGAKHLIMSGEVKMGGVHRLPADQGPTPHDYYVPVPTGAHLARGTIPVASSILTPCRRASGYAGRQLMPDGRMVPLEIKEHE